MMNYIYLSLCGGKWNAMNMDPSTIFMDSNIVRGLWTCHRHAHRRIDGQIFLRRP